MELYYYKLKMPLKNKFTTSFGTDVNKDVFIFKLINDNITAYSESVTDENPFYGPEDNYTAFHIIKDYLIKVLKDLPDIEEFNNNIKFVKENNMAKAAIEMLLYDYYSKLDKKPLYKYIGKTRGYANVGISLGIDDINVTIKNIEDALNKKYKRIKVKIKKGEEIKILKEIRDHFPDIVLTADANSDYTLKDLGLLKKLDRFDLNYLEQPLCHDDLIYHSKLAKEINTPICLDESITSPEKAEKAFEINACKIINIKPGRVGGFYNSLKIADIAKKYNGHTWVGGMLETGIGRSFNVSLASLSIIDYPGDTSPNEKYFENDIVKNTFKMENGEIKPYDDYGIGVDIDNDYFNKYMVDNGKLI